MSSIDEAIEQIEKSAQKEQELLAEESKAIKDAVAKAGREAKEKVKAEYAEKLKLVRQEAREARKYAKEARARIEKALQSEPSAPAKRAKKGERDAQFLAFVKEHPDKKLSEIARGIGIQPQSANGVAKRLVKQGKVKRSASKTYRVA
jgi:hypothetical protein